MNFKEGKDCVDCGESDPICLDFHHRSPIDKLFEVPRNTGFSLKQVQEEIEKCDLVCANCHRKRHRIIGFPTNGVFKSTVIGMCRNALHKMTPENVNKNHKCVLCRRAGRKRWKKNRTARLKIKLEGLSS